ncbi:MAG: hypothetical protein CVV41_06730 [Candidatus Riflebacteria bacterium HGW-Riflebacteria-1]|jgi:hypothetical protein|nr:MAG: hypothetical protein CVV41_06730 [Candidatus Riflebacteria bacterium HGW-Riflebacteria-1]
MTNKPTLTIKEFLALPDGEKATRFGEMSERDRFLWRTQYDIPALGKVVEHEPPTPEEQARIDEEFNAMLRRRGVKI